MAKRSAPADLFGGRAPALIPEALGGTREKQLVFGGTLDPAERARREAAAAREREAERARAERAAQMGPRTSHLGDLFGGEPPRAARPAPRAAPRAAQPTLAMSPDEEARERRRAVMGATAGPLESGPLFGRR